MIRFGNITFWLLAISIFCGEAYSQGTTSASSKHDNVVTDNPCLWQEDKRPDYCHVFDFRDALLTSDSEGSTLPQEALSSKDEERLSLLGEALSQSNEDPIGLFERLLRQNGLQERAAGGS